MSATDIGSIQPNPYLFKIDSQRNRRAKLAHEAGAGSKCKQCKDKCKGFELHFWRKICQNCRCSKDDHEIEDDDEDIGRLVIGKLFNRPIRTHEEEESYSYGTNLEIVDTATGKREEMVFDWVPPGAAKSLATRYMEMLPPDKRPVTGSQAARDRKKQLEQQLPLYDMDENERCENMPAKEYENFQKYMDTLKSDAVGQASIQEIIPTQSGSSPVAMATHQAKKYPNQPAAVQPLLRPFNDMSLQCTPDNRIDPNCNQVNTVPLPPRFEPLPKPISHIEVSQPYGSASSQSSARPMGQFVSPHKTTPNPNHNGSPHSIGKSPQPTPPKPHSVSATCIPLNKNLLPAASGFYAAESNANIILPQESQILTQIKPHTVPTDPSPAYHCQHCEGPMIPGDVAVLCDKAGPEKFWHPNCFVCTTCDELLADLIYFYKEGNIYCGRHYHQASNIPRCHACDELIFSDSWTRADDFDWHIHHYSCFVCDTPLAGHKYIPDHRSYPHCIPCYMAFIAKMCETCELKISPEQPRAGYHGYFFHGLPECFSCYSCKKSLLGDRFKMVKNWLFCSQDCVNNCSDEIANNPNEKEKSI